MTDISRDSRCMIPLGAIADFRNGVNFAASQRGHGIPILNVKDFQDRLHPEYRDLDELRPEAVRDDALLRAGDVLFVRSNGNKDLIGRSMFLPSNPHSAFTIRVRFHSPDADPQYCAYYLRGGIVRAMLSAHGSGTNISNLNQEILSRLRIWLPNRGVQRRIAGILSAYDDLIEVNARRIAILEEMARRLFDEWFVQARFPENLKSNDTREFLLAALVEFAKGRKPKATREKPLPGDMPLLLIDVLRGGTPVYASSRDIVIAEKRDTLMVMDGASSCDVAIGFSGVVGSTLAIPRNRPHKIL